MSAAEPSARVRRSEQTRIRLVEAGLVLAESFGIAELTADRVVATAGVAKGTYFHHFGDRASYLVALHQEFHERIFGQVERAIEPLDPGRARLIAAATAYLDAVSASSGVRALLLEARAVPAVAAEIDRRNELAAERLTPDFEALGSQWPKESAQLWVRMVAEAALLEHSRRRRQPKVRTALIGFLEISPHV